VKPDLKVYGIDCELDLVIFADFVSISVFTLVAKHTSLHIFFFSSFCFRSHIFFKYVCATKQRQSIKGGTSFSNLKFIFYAYSDANIFLSVVPFI